jgi:hypothetical protein
VGIDAVLIICVLLAEKLSEKVLERAVYAGYRNG